MFKQLLLVTFGQASCSDSYRNVRKAGSECLEMVLVAKISSSQA